jgi:predicted DNA-binding transcriptional regulator AlpA
MENTEVILPSSGAEPFPGRRSLSEAKPDKASLRKPPKSVLPLEPLLTAEDVARRLNVSTDWVWDHSSRKKPLLPVIRMGDGALRYRASGIEAFIDERERLSAMRRRA